MSKFQVGDKITLVNVYNLPDVTDPTGVVIAVIPTFGVAENIGSQYSIRWDDGWVDDPQVYYYGSELKKAEEQ